MYEPKFTENNDEFATDTVIEFNIACPFCGKASFNSIVTRVIKDMMVFECIHCDKMYVIRYYAFPPAKLKMVGKEEKADDKPFHYDVYKCDVEPTDTDRSYAVFEDE
jgi:hypothetical protein